MAGPCLSLANVKRFLRPTLSGLLVVAIAASVGLRVPYILMTPGPVFNTIGTIDDKPVITVSGAKTYRTSGELNMTTVSEYGGNAGGISLWQAVSGWFSRHDRVVPREFVYPDDRTREENRQQSAEEYVSSQSYAIAAAMTFLELPVNQAPVVITVEEGAPAQNKLHAGDIITAVDGHATKVPGEVVKWVRAAQPGTMLTFAIVRDGFKREVKVTTGSRPDDPATAGDEAAQAYIGIAVDAQYTANFDITFGVDGVGGPSGGLMFTLGLIDMLTPESMTGGNVVAGTGTIDPDGTVGDIGGIQQKMVGARSHGAVLFLAPAGNCDDVVGHIPAGLTVASVHTVAEGVAAVEDFASGLTPTPCAVH